LAHRNPKRSKRFMPWYTTVYSGLAVCWKISPVGRVG